MRLSLGRVLVPTSISKSSDECADGSKRSTHVGAA